MKKKAYLQISFAWLFAIIVGIFILSLAIYFSAKLFKTEQTIQSAETGKEIGILLNPLETGFESGKSNSIEFPIETRIYNKCNSNGNFGRQLISVSQKNFNKWTETEINVGFSNKYIFSEEFVEGELFYLFSKPFEFPFKISDIIYITPSKNKYCFVNPPEEIEEELLFLNQENLVVNNCTENSIEVCFTGSCEIKVDLENKRVRKNSEDIYFEGDSLMYAAIFSDKNTYECQTKRLIKRLDNLALLYNDKATLVSQKNCNTDLDLISLSNLANSYEDSADLSVINSLSQEIQNQNNYAECKLW